MNAGVTPSARRLHAGTRELFETNESVRGARWKPRVATPKRHVVDRPRRNHEALAVLGQQTQIDCVVKEQGESEFRVMLEVHHGEWLRARALALLEEKLNVYAGFVLDGQMRSLYPASSKENTVIVVASVEPIPEMATRLLEQAVRAFERHGLRLIWNPEGGLPSGGTPPPSGFNADWANKATE